MKRLSLIIISILAVLTSQAHEFLSVTEKQQNKYFPLACQGVAASIVTDARDFAVVNIAAEMLADDVERVTGLRPALMKTTGKHLPKDQRAVVVAGTVGKSKLIDDLIRSGRIDVNAIKGKWESFVITTIQQPHSGEPLLVIAGSDRRGTAFGLTSLCEAIGVSPWYWWADVQPQQKRALFVQSGTFCQKEPAIRALPTLHVYEGREVRYAVQLGNEKPVVFSIHSDDFCAEWRWNVLRGYSSRSIQIPADLRGSQELKVYFLDPGVVLQEIAVQ